MDASHLTSQKCANMQQVWYAHRLCNRVSYCSGLVLSYEWKWIIKTNLFLYYSTLELIFFILKETPCSYNPLEILRPRPSSTALIRFLSSTMSRGTLTSISTSSFNFFESTNLTLWSLVDHTYQLYQAI